MRRLIDRISDVFDRITSSPKLAEALLLVVTAVLIGRSVSFEFLLGDDYANIVANHHMQSPEPDDLLVYWFAPYLQLYIPCTYTFWLAEAAICEIFPSDEWPGGLNPAVFRMGNILLYLACVSLVFRFLRRLSDHVGAAFIGAMFFALHPLHVESIAWITETKNLLAGVFAGLCLVCYPFAQAVDPSREPDRMRRFDYFLAGLFFLLSLLSKPSGVTLPAVIVILDWIVFGRPLRMAVLRSAPLFLVAVPIALATAFFRPTKRMPKLFRAWGTSSN